MQMRIVMTSWVVQLKQNNTQSRMSPEILEQCSSNLAPEMYIKKKSDNYYVVAMATLLAPVSFCEKPNVPISNLTVVMATARQVAFGFFSDVQFWCQV